MTISINMNWNDEKLQNLDKVNNILFKIKSKTNNIIFVYTPPKVGSTSLVSSIRISAPLKFSVLHIHDDLMLNVLTGYNDITVNDVILYNKLLGKNVYVIDIFRTPIERKMSEYFEKLSCYHFNNSEDNLNNYNIDKIINRFNKLFPYLASKDYFQEVYNINFPESFDFENKFLLLQENGINYIKLRLMDSKLWGSILTNILDTEIVIIHDYETENKKIGDLYRKFKMNYSIPINLINLLSESRMISYYLSEEEMLQYMTSWGNKVTEKEVVPYTEEEYNFYMNLCVENNFYNDMKNDHYIDVGCICKKCCLQRNELFKKAKCGEKIKEKIIHNKSILNTNIINRIINSKVNNKVNNLNKVQKNKKTISNLLSNVINLKRS